MTQFIIDYKMYKDIGIYTVKGMCYPRTYYSLGIGLIEYKNWIFNFMTDNHCCFYDSGVFENMKLHWYSYMIHDGDSVIL
jgi:hypothetical protein